jgi:Tol biopolymer transport system component
MDGDRQPMNLFKGRAGRFSPDGRWIAYNSDETGRFELYLAPVNLASPSSIKPFQVTKDGAVGGIFWRPDAKELVFFGNPEQVVMAVDVTTSPNVQTGTPRVLFKNPAPVLGPAQLSSVANRQGDRFVFLPTAPPQR